MSSKFSKLLMTQVRKYETQIELYISGSKTTDLLV